MGFDAFNLPQSVYAVLVLWATCIFVVWYFYRHTKKENLYRGGLRTVIMVVSSLFFFTMAILWLKNRPTYHPVRVGVFPFKDVNSKAENMSWEGLAAADMTQTLLEQIGRGRLLAYPVEWLLASANTDSLYFSDYIRDFSERIDLDYAVWGEIRKVGSSYQLRDTLLDLSSRDEVHAEYSLDNPYELINFAEILSEKIASQALTEDHELINTIEFCCQEQIEFYFKARMATQAGDWHAALPLAGAAVAQDSTASVCLNLLADLKIRQAREIQRQGGNAFSYFKQAKELLLKANEQNTQNFVSLRLLGDLYLANEKWNEAERYLFQSYELNPYQPELLLSLTQLHPQRYSVLGFANDRELLRRAVEINPAFLEGHLSLAELYSLKNRHDLALKVVQKVIRINPLNVDGLMSLAKIYMLKKDVLRTLETYEKVLALEPQNADVFYNLGIVYYYEKDYANATKYFNHAITVADHLDSRLYLAYIYEKQGDTTKAVQYLRERIGKRRHEDDRFAEEARKHLFEIMRKRGVIDSLMTKSSNSR